MGLHRKHAFLLFLLLGVLGCEEPNYPGPLPDPDPNEEGYAFVYTPPAGAPALTSISVRGSFNAWAETAMEEQDDGSWVAYVELDSTTLYSYKFFINGNWISDMCSDPTWGHESEGGLVHLDADGCESDGFGGQNALITLGEIGLGFTHSAGDPEFVSVAGDRLSIRFRANEDRIASASVIVAEDTVAMHLQLGLGLQEVWRVSVPPATTSYSFLLETTDGVETFGPYEAPADPFRSVSWASDAVAYQIFPERFWNGDPSNDSLTLSTDEFVYN
ncbi:MAG TPA: hypothetical protein VMN78_11625, partial [Longimicrobiales bacterium]|nr:hypothetical protein [Longimicrobiales bacterium]